MTGIGTSRWTRVALRTLLTAAVGAVVALPLPATGQTALAEPQATFTKDIVPILQRSCQKCHRPEGGAPMSLISYQDVRPWARSIKNRTASRQMPPWFIDKNIGIQRYKDDPSLSNDEIAAIARWVDHGAPLGEPADLPPPREWPADGWTYGTPGFDRARHQRVPSRPTRPIGSASGVLRRRG